MARAESAETAEKNRVGQRLARRLAIPVLLCDLCDLGARLVL